MPQNAIAGNVAIGPNKTAVPLRANANGELEVAGAVSSTLNVTTSTVVKAAAGQVFRVNTVVGGSAEGGIYDCLTTGTADVVAANLVAKIGTIEASFNLEWPFQKGIVLVPGTGQTLSISFD